MCHLTGNHGFKSCSRLFWHETPWNRFVTKWISIFNSQETRRCSRAVLYIKNLIVEFKDTYLFKFAKIQTVSWINWLLFLSLNRKSWVQILQQTFWHETPWNRFVTKWISIFNSQETRRCSRAVIYIKNLVAEFSDVNIYLSLQRWNHGFKSCSRLFWQETPWNRFVTKWTSIFNLQETRRCSRAVLYI